jgi:hypothetical protein
MHSWLALESTTCKRLRFQGSQGIELDVHLDRVTVEPLLTRACQHEWRYKDHWGNFCSQLVLLVRPDIQSYSYRIGSQQWHPPSVRIIGKHGSKSCSATPDWNGSLFVIHDRLQFVFSRTTPVITAALCSIFWSNNRRRPRMPFRDVRSPMCWPYRETRHVRCLQQRTTSPVLIC